jgi:hypothetical protein
MADGRLRPIVPGGFGVSIICDAKQNPWNDNVSRCAANSATQCSGSSVVTLVQIVPSGKDNQYPLNKYVSLEAYTTIY